MNSMEKAPQANMTSNVLEELRGAAWSTERAERFLAAWKSGIKLVGAQYFHIVGSVESATNKWDLMPNRALIEHSLHQVSKGQAILLAVMYSFYNGDDGQLYLEQLGYPNISDIAAHLDKEEVAVVADLLVNYSGW